MRQFALLLALSFSLTACSETSIIPEPDGMSVTEFSVSRVESTLDRSGNNHSSAWKTIRLNSRKDLWDLTFVDSLNGWVADRRTIFRTTDGGVTWNDLPFLLQPNEDKEILTFVDSRSGWLTVRETRKDRYDYDFSTTIFSTRDGGMTWTKQFSGTGIAIADLEFIDDKLGWIVGAKVEMKDIVRASLFLSRTEDGGATWTDLSENLSKFSDLAKSNIRDLTNVLVTGPNSATILGLDNQMIETTNGGETWTLIGEVGSPSKLLQFVPKGGGGFSMLAGGDNKHGIGSSYFTKVGENAWEERRYDGLYLRQGVSLNDHVFACGSILSKDYETKGDNRRFGVVVHSSDGGRNWTVIYENKRVPRVNAIALAGKERLIIVGEKGLVSSLDLKEVGL